MVQPDPEEHDFNKQVSGMKREEYSYIYFIMYMYLVYKIMYISET